MRDPTRSLGRLAALVLAACATGCASTPAPGPKEPTAPGSALLGVLFEARPPIAFGSEPQRVVAFVKLEEGEDPLAADTWLQASYEEGGRVYLLDAEPGEYVAVACAAEGMMTFLDEDMIRRTRVTVPRGGVAFMGKFVVDQHFSWSGSDAAQKHYRKLMGDAPWISHTYRGSHDESARDAASEKKFLSAALGSFRGTAWAPRIEARLAELAGAR